jgi:translocation and assembly module TamA
VGSIYGAELSELAPSRRLYAGGGGSVRGFGFQELGPKVEVANPKFDPTDPEEKDDPTIFIPTGGRSLVEFAVEARYRFGNYGVVGFVDAGQVYESQTPRLNDMRFGVGVGGRLYTNFGPMRADVAIPLGRRKGESKFAVYVSIGQAF